MVSLSFLVCLMTVITLVKVTHGHGRLREPPSRSSMWRDGFDTPPNYDDNALYCGGFSNQWYTHGGKCGLCGDPWQGPRANEPGGMYANGIITRSYSSGSNIEVQVELTANHLGWFEFRICPINNPNINMTQDCLDRYLLPATNGGATRFHIDETLGFMTYQLRLPDNLSCSFCTLQWKYNAGNSWGTDPDGTECVGCGPQEQFYGCADVSIN